MEVAQDYLEIKKQLFELIETSNKTIEKKTLRINQELASLYKGNQHINLKIKELIEKIDGLSFRTNTTLVTEVSSQLSANNLINAKQHSRTLNKLDDSKINIQNLVINKKVQIGKHFSKLNINNISTSPIKTSSYHIDRHSEHPVRHLTNVNQKKTVPVIKMRIFSKNKKKKSENSPEAAKEINSNKVITHSYDNHLDSNKSNRAISNHSKKKSSFTRHDEGLKSSKSINDIRKLSIMDIPSFDMITSLKKKKKSEKSMRNYLYSKEQKLHYLLAKQNILPLRLRLIFTKKISNFYTIDDAYADYSQFILFRYNKLLSLQEEYQPFVPSLTSQVALNFVTSTDEKKCMNMLSNTRDNDDKTRSNGNGTGNEMLSQEQLHSFYNLLLVFYYLVNEPIDDSLPKDAFNLFNDLLSRVLVKANSTFLKTHQLEALNRASLLSPYQLCHIQAIYSKIVESNFKPFDKVSSAMLFLLKDIFDYSLIQMSNGESMIQYNYSLNRLEKLKAELEQRDLK